MKLLPSNSSEIALLGVELKVVPSQIIKEMQGKGTIKTIRNEALVCRLSFKIVAQ